MQELETGIENLSQSFLSLSNILFEEDLLRTHPRVTSALQKITQQCVSLAGQGCDDQPASTETAADTKHKSDLQDIDLSFDADAETTRLSFAENSIHLPLSLTQWSDPRPTTTPPYHEQGILPFGLILASPSPSFNTPSPGLPSPPATVSPSSLTREGRWTLSHRIVRECCENAYQLLINMPHDHPRVQKVFGHEITLAERNRLISAFHLGMQDEVGDVLELKTRILDPLRSSNETWSLEQIARSSRTWQLVVETGFDQWLDASGVQRFLQQRGIYILESDSPHSSPHIDAPSNIDMAAFIRRECCVYSGLHLLTS